MWCLRVSTLQELRAKQKLMDMAAVVIDEFIPPWLQGSALAQVRQRVWDINLRESEELIRKLKAILVS